METSDRLVWRKSSRSDNNGGACVEMATVNEGVLIRDSKDPEGPVLRFGRQHWQAFLTRFAEQSR
ncbi:MULTISPECIES: DUF397 domain-containing protein [Micromonospora]|uniref:DUF397 domain-containing protein n=1 Tax=Micromonospora solifontis TaxID=2487138 RepID=A0ABX9WPQ8_9ACTN|nr:MULTISPECIES: DUF397 domain-containing protein [Micromonospora]NES12858.1 DUF397 domain-containing protein [Micromonospora sp. PPF5-17B]NES34824.1 DUF397 domain-containing protein [Micromonospora solifontis]NES54783.1 DUF397 domain-containing protein [Micromonospora sp. PPF5-6]RNM01762.1 DUF397 domain-containing protein [Micromonospora solifontis]